METHYPSHFTASVMRVHEHVCACVSSAIHHPICQQRQSSALSRTKNWLRAPLIGLSVAAILPYSSVREGASQA